MHVVVVQDEALGLGETEDGRDYGGYLDADVLYHQSSGPHQVLINPNGSNLTLSAPHMQLCTPMPITGPERSFVKMWCASSGDGANQHVNVNYTVRSTGDTVHTAARCIGPLRQPWGCAPSALQPESLPITS